MANNDKTSGEPQKLITVSPDQLQAMITDGVLNVMASLKEADATDRKVGEIDYDKLGAAIGDAVASGYAKTQRPKVTPGQYVKRPYSVFHTKGVGDDKRVKLSREYYINGDLCRESRLSDEEIELLNRLTHAGRYIDRMVEVILRPNGVDDAVEIRFSNKLENYMPLKAVCGKNTLEGMLKLIVTQQEVEDEDFRLADEERKQRRAKAQANVAATRG